MSETTRRPVARHGQLRSPSAWGQLLKMLGIALAVVLVSGVGVAAATVYDMTTSYTAGAFELEGQEDLPPDIGAFEGGFNLLLTGVDTCEEEYSHLFPGRCDGPDAEGTLNDVNILVHVSDEPRKITAISFPRDLMLPIPSCEDENGRATSSMSKQPLNTAVGVGGLNCVARTITALTGQEIQFAASVTFGGVIEITNAVGGVEVCLENGIRDSHTLLDMEAGTHTISGYEALQFLRTRHGVGDGSDLGRIGNQQQYMSSLVRKLVSEDVLTNPRTLLSLASTGLANVTPSTSLTNPVLVGQIALVLKDVPFEDIVFVQYPVNDDPADRNRVVPNRTAAKVLWEALAENKSLEITHEGNKHDGVVIKEDEAIEAGGETPAPVESADPAATDAPTADEAVALPPSIRGNSAAQVTCSNGNVRG